MQPPRKTLFRAAATCLAAVVGTATGMYVAPDDVQARYCEQNLCETFWVDECEPFTDVNYNCDYNKDGGCSHTKCDPKET